MSTKWYSFNLSSTNLLSEQKLFCNWSKCRKQLLMGCQPELIYLQSNPLKSGSGNIPGSRKIQEAKIAPVR